MGYNVGFVDNPQKGRPALFHQRPNQLQSAARKTWEPSLREKGAKLFNMAPKGTEGQDWDSTAVPEQPIVNGRQRGTFAPEHSVIE